MGPKDRPTPIKARPSNVAGQPEQQEATASTAQAAATADNVNKYAGKGARPKGLAHAVPPYVAFSSPTFEVARDAALCKMGQDDKVNSTHGHLLDRMIGLRGELLQRVEDLTKPSKTDRKLFEDIADVMKGTSQYYRERRATLMSLEHTYEEQGGLLIEALQKRWSTFIDIFKDQEKHAIILSWRQSGD